MTKFQRGIHSLLLSLAFSALSWMIVDSCIINIAFYKYLMIEVLVTLSMKLYVFTLTKTNLQ